MNAFIDYFREIREYGAEMCVIRKMNRQNQEIKNTVKNLCYNINSVLRLYSNMKITTEIISRKRVGSSDKSVYKYIIR